MNKESHVYVNRIRIPQSKVERETARNSFQTALDRAKGCMRTAGEGTNPTLATLAYLTTVAPRANADIIVRTPSPPARESLLDNIPWRHFQIYIAGRKCYKGKVDYRF